MISNIGWRIQVSPHHEHPESSRTYFLNVEIPDEAAAIDFVRARGDIKPSDRVYAVRPLNADEVQFPAVSRTN